MPIRVEAPFILHTTKNLYHGNLNQLEMGREHVNIIDVERVHHKCVGGFTSSGLAMATHAFDFMANLNKDC
jgi:hypothetical protein